MNGPPVTSKRVTTEEAIQRLEQLADVLGTIHGDRVMVLQIEGAFERLRDYVNQNADLTSFQQRRIDDLMSRFRR